MNSEALKELLYKMADDQLILGHRNSEWTGIGPLLEEDIAFSSMAQDKLGHSQALYQLLNQLGEADPDTIAFHRKASSFKNCQLVELPIGEYDFSLIRHFLYDLAEKIRFEMLTESAYQPLALVAKKFLGELRYHELHAITWVKQLGTATGESIERLQESLVYALPYALGIFEPSPYEAELIASGVFEGEAALQSRWSQKIKEVLSQTRLVMPNLDSVNPVYGGRIGKHTEYLQPLLNEMTEVVLLDPAAEW
jgi:ring-1,2-phenylacetyl-CoA epoxidase subunit PaaC